MVDCKLIIDELVKTVIKDQKIVGILLTGSYAKGLQHPGSDMDVIIVTTNDTLIRTRGNVEIQGVLVEYYCNTYRQIMKYFEIDWLHNNPMIYMAFKEGLIVYERYKSISKLKKLANDYADRPFNELAPNRVSFEKYVIEDMKNKMMSLAEKHNQTFDLSYYTNLRSIYEFYAKFLKQPVVKMYMLEDYLGENNRFNDSLDTFPDRTFASLFLDAIKNVELRSIEESLENYCKVSDYVQQMTGTFKMDGWSLTLPVDYSSKMDTRTRIF